MRGDGGQGGAVRGAPGAGWTTGAAPTLGDRLARGLPWLLLGLAGLVVAHARTSQVPEEFGFLQQVWQRGGEVPAGQHRQLELGRLFHASGVMAAVSTTDLAWWQPGAGSGRHGAEQFPTGRAAREVPLMFRDGERRTGGPAADWATGLLAGAAAPLRVHVGDDPLWLQAELIYVERAALNQLAQQLARAEERFDWQVSCNGLHLLGRGARPVPAAGVGTDWRRAEGTAGPAAADWVLDVGGAEWPPLIERKLWRVVAGGLLAVSVAGGMAVCGAFLWGLFWRRRRWFPAGGGSPAEWVAVLALGWCASVLAVSMAGAVAGGTAGLAPSAWQKPAWQAFFVGVVALAVALRLVNRARARGRAGVASVPGGLPEIGDADRLAGGWWSRAGWCAGWGLIAATVVWLAARALVQVPFDAPGLVTHGYKALLFDRLGAADPWVLLEAGREFARPHYPHGFSVSAWLTMPPAGWRHGVVAQWQVVLPLALAALVLGRAALAVSGNRWPALVLVALWAGSWPVQRVPGTWYAEPLMLLFWCGALACWLKVLEQGSGRDSSVGEGLDDAGSGMVRAALAGGFCAAAMIWVKNEGLLWWLVAVIALAIGVGVSAWNRRRAGGGGIMPPCGRILAAAMLPGVATALLWWGWRGWHGLADADFSMEALLAMDSGERVEVIRSTAMVVRLWMFGEGWAWPFGGIWWLLAASVACFGWRHRCDPVAGWLLAICLVGVLMPLMIFPFTTVEPLDRHLIAVWRLMLFPSAAALLLVARLWARRALIAAAKPAGSG